MIIIIFLLLQLQCKVLLFVNLFLLNILLLNKYYFRKFFLFNSLLDDESGYFLFKRTNLRINELNFLKERQWNSHDTLAI